MGWLKTLMCKHKKVEIIGTTQWNDTDITANQVNIYKCVRCGKTGIDPLRDFEENKPCFVCREAPAKKRLETQTGGVSVPGVT